MDTVLPRRASHGKHALVQCAVELVCRGLSPSKVLEEARKISEERHCLGKVLYPSLSGGEWKDRLSVVYCSISNEILIDQLHRN